MRKTFEIPDDIHDWYVENAKSLAMPASALMVFALKNYIDQQKSLISIGDVVQELKKANKTDKK